MSIFTKDISVGNCKAKPKKKYFTKYNEKYKNEYPWTSSSYKGETFAFCTLCKVDICIKSVGAKGLRDHEFTYRHTQSCHNASNHLEEDNPNNEASSNNNTSSKASELDLASSVIQNIPSSTPSEEEKLPETSKKSDSSAALICNSNHNSNSHSTREGLSQPDSTSNGLSHLFRSNLASSFKIKTEIDPSLPVNMPLSPKILQVSSSSEDSDNFGISSSAATGEPIGEYINCQPTERIVDIPIDNNQSKLKELHTEPKTNTNSLSSDPLMPSTEDLTCNICGVVFDSWKALKKDLETHVRQAQVTRTVTNPKISPRARGRPKGSKNKNKLILGPPMDLSMYADEKPMVIQNLHLSSANRTSSKKISEKCPKNKVHSKMDKLRNKVSCVDKNCVTSNLDVNKSLQSSLLIRQKNNLAATKDEQLVEKIVDESLQSRKGLNDCNKSEKKRCFYCRVCKDQFSTRKALRLHIQSHNNGRPYKCDICDMSFTTKNNCTVHMEHKHSKSSDTCKCSVCNKVLSSPANLKIHQMIHTGEKRFICPVCEKRFSRKANMETHLLYHTGERKFTCEICDQSFFAINALKRHLKLHSGERNFVCEICGATYITSTDLRRHSFKHQDVKPFSCHICEKQFIRSHDLKVHLRYHAKDLRFTCSVCKKQFVESGNYRRHMRRHTGERPYMCNVCNKTFIQVHHYKLHMKSIHPDELEPSSESHYPRMLVIHKNPSSSQKISFMRPSQSKADYHHQELEPDLDDPIYISSNNVESSILNTNLAPPHPNERAPPNTTQPLITTSSILATSTSTSEDTPITHTVSIPMVQTVASLQSSESQAAPYWNLPYSSYVYSSSVVPHYHGIIEVCSEESSSHIESDFRVSK